MEKPISLIIEDFRQNLSQVVQSSGLPVVIVDMILKDLYSEIHTLAKEVTIKDMNEYKKGETESDNSDNIRTDS